MMHLTTRRNFLAGAAPLPALFPARGLAAGKAEITVGLTVDTLPD